MDNVRSSDRHRGTCRTGAAGIAIGLRMSVRAFFRLRRGCGHIFVCMNIVFDNIRHEIGVQCRRTLRLLYMMMTRMRESVVRRAEEKRCSRKCH